MQPGPCPIEQLLRQRLDLASLERVRADEEINNLDTPFSARNARRKAAEEAQSAGISELVAHRSTCNTHRGRQSATQRVASDEYVGETIPKRFRPFWLITLQISLGELCL
jgi:hypothetical protein